MNSERAGFSFLYNREELAFLYDYILTEFSDDVDKNTKLPFSSSFFIYFFPTISLISVFAFLKMRFNTIRFLI